MPGTRELLLPPGLVLAKGAMEQGLIEIVAPDFRKLAAEQMYGGGPEVAISNPVAFGAVRSEFQPETVEFLRGLGVSDQHDVTFNLQAALGFQGFHHDGAPTTVIYFEGQGAFEYAPAATCASEAEREHVRVDVDPGDLIFNASLSLLHRGRNLGQTERITAGIFEPR